MLGRLSDAGRALPAHFCESECLFNTAQLRKSFYVLGGASQDSVQLNFEKIPSNRTTLDPRLVPSKSTRHQPIGVTRYTNSVTQISTYIWAHRGVFHTSTGMIGITTMGQAWPRTHRFFPLNSCGRLTTKFSGTPPYVDVRLTDDVLDLVDPRPELFVSEYGIRLICRG